MNSFPHRLVVATRALAFCLLPLLLAGCISQPRIAEPISDADFAETAFVRTHLFYLQSTTYKRMYVEIDAVKGSEPKDATLAELQRFLATYCQKPEGIQLVRDDVISRQDAQGLSPEALTRRYLSGPPKDLGPVAYLYILYYDGALCDRPLIGPDGQPLKREQPSARRGDNPHVNLLPYSSAIYVNSRYGPKRVQWDLIKHEAGHILGQARRAEGTEHLHCLSENCLMRMTLKFQVGRWLTFRDPITQHELCADCRAALQNATTNAAPSNLRFMGPVLVRTEPGYHVLTLPDHAGLLIGELTDQDYDEFVAWVKAGPEDPLNDSQRYHATTKNMDPDALLEVLARIKKDDPMKIIHTAAAALENFILEQKKNEKK